MSESEFVFDAPQFVDFNKSQSEDEENIEGYFEKKHEIDVNKEECKEDYEGIETEFDQFFTPMKSPKENKSSKEFSRRKLRRSMSVGDFPAAEIVLNNNKADSELSEALKKVKLSNGSENKKTFRSRTVSLTKLKSTSRLNLLKLAEPRTKSNQNGETQKYVTMAEAIKRFYTATPPRFHTKNKNYVPSFKPVATSITATIPQTPNLCVKTRSRPLHILSKEEKEALELEEAKKHKIKAHPVNHKILEGPVRPIHIEKKPATKPEPFKLTEIRPRKMSTSSESSEVFEFRAQPVPKSLNKPFKPVIKQPALPNKNNTPAFVRRLTKLHVNNEKKDEMIKKGHEKAVLTLTEPKPFSFEERDKMLVKRKEELIQKVLQEEKKAREFHANPIPKRVFKSPQTNNTYLNSKQNSFKKREEMETTQFKARPARVLHMKPFEPKKAERTLVEITDFHLNTEKRAKEREQFEQTQKEKEMKILRLKEEYEERKKMMEQEEIARIRKEAEHKAQPIKHYKELPVVPTKPVTVPISPKFMTNDRVHNKENNVHG